MQTQIRIQLQLQLQIQIRIQLHLSWRLCLPRLLPLSVRHIECGIDVDNISQSNVFPLLPVVPLPRTAVQMSEKTLHLAQPALSPSLVPAPPSLAHNRLISHGIPELWLDRIICLGLSS